MYIIWLLSTILQPNFPLGEAVDNMDMRTLMMTVVVVSVTILSIKVSVILSFKEMCMHPFRASVWPSFV